MSRASTVKNLYDKKHSTFKLDAPLSQVMGEPESNGIWFIWGSEKNGKTWFALKLADYLSAFSKIMYISAEEGKGLDFVRSCKRANIDVSNKNMQFYEYLPFEELEAKLSKKRSANIIFLDNATIYADEIKKSTLIKLKEKYSKKLFIIIAHEERHEPYTALAKLSKKLAKVIVYVKGLACHVSGRCPGGILTINEQKAKLFYGNDIEDSN